MQTSGKRHYIDISAAVHSRAGLGRYSENIANALIKTDPDRFALFYNQGGNGRFPTSLPQSIPQRHINIGYKPWRMAVLLGQQFVIPFNRFVPDADIFHSTEHLLMPLKGIPTVLTVHDLIFKLFPEYHKKLNYWYLNTAMPLFCRKADAIIAVSQASKQDIVKHYGIDPAKIHVVYEAASSQFKPVSPAKITQVKQTYDLPDRYLIHLSTIEPRKNLNRLLDSLKALRLLFSDLTLVLAGGKGWLYDDFFAKIEALELRDAVHVLGWIPDEDLPAILAGADLAVQPSLYEGFGLPILEHMAVGQVVAASNASSFPEVGGEAAVYFDPTDVEEMTAVIQHLLTNKEEYQGLTGAGIGALVAAVGTALGDRAARAGSASHARQRDAIGAAAEAVAAALRELEREGPRVELVAEELRAALRALDFLIGRVDVEALLDVVFRSFCIGK